MASLRFFGGGDEAKTPMQTFIAYLSIGGYKTTIEIEAEKPEEVIQTIKDTLKEIEGKVGEVRLADKKTGYFIRGFS